MDYRWRNLEMKRPKKKENLKHMSPFCDYHEEDCKDCYNQALEDMDAYLPNEEEILRVLKQRVLAKEPLEESAKAIHKRISE